LRNPKGIAVGPDGALYIADWLSFRVMRLGQDGKLSAVVRVPQGRGGGGTGPNDVAFDAQGTMFISTPSEIYRRLPSGYLTMVLSNSLCCMSKIEFGPDGNLYLANEQTNQILRVRPNGDVSEVASGLQHPFDVAFSPSGEMYVSEFGKDVLKVQSDGTTSLFAKADFGGYGPLHITFDSQGNLYAHGNGRLFKFDSSGQDMNLKIDGNDPRGMLGYPKANPGGIVFDRNGYLYVVDGPNAKIIRISSEGHLEIIVRGFNPNGIAVGPDQNIYAISSADFPQGQGELLQITPEGKLNVVARFDDAPQTMAADAMGNIYIALSKRSSHRVVRLDLDGKIQDWLPKQQSLYGNLAVAPSGTMYASSPEEGRIYKVANDGSRSIFTQGLPTTLPWMFTLASSPAGTLHAADSTSGNIIRFSDSGMPTVVTHITSIIGAPNAIAVAPHGDIFVIAGRNYHLLQILQSGTVRDAASGVWGDPIGLAFDQKGNLYISRSGTIDRVTGLMNP
jgi:sugar lactone lactonase YvrE